MRKNHNLGIKHIEFWVSDLQKSLHFYSPLFAIIGWKKLDKNSFVCNGSKIYFLQHRALNKKTIGPRHICFLANSQIVVNTVGFFLKSIKAKIIHEPSISNFKNRICYMTVFKDPDGYILEVATNTISQKPL